MCMKIMKLITFWQKNQNVINFTSDAMIFKFEGLTKYNLDEFHLHESIIT